MKWMLFMSMILVSTWLMLSIVGLDPPARIYGVAWPWPWLIFNAWAGYAMGRDDERARLRRLFQDGFKGARDTVQILIEEADDGVDSAGQVDNKRTWQGGTDRA